MTDFLTLFVACFIGNLIVMYGRWAWTSRVSKPRRRRAGLCDSYVVDGWYRIVRWCPRQTPDHKVHIFSNDSDTALSQDADLRNQGL